MKALKYFIAAFLALFFIAGKPSEFGREANFFQGFMIPKPVIKIGLITKLKQASITASSGMKIYQVGREYQILSDEADEAVIRVDKEKLSEKFILLLTQTKDRQEAEMLAAEVSQKVLGPIEIEEKNEGGESVYYVKYGEFLTRGQALEAIHQLEKLGNRDVWIIKEDISLPEAGQVWLQINHRLLSINKEADLYFIPSNAQSFLSLNGKSYRGIFVLKNTTRGLSLINILNIEDYLKGVVPLELSPVTFNAVEALKAQAVAARTYALKNLGKNDYLGFDLTDTQSSQVYGGLSVEDPLSNLAVDQTAGEVILYKGKLIDALYTSTCGGMTEDAENVFSGESVPYLKSTVCTCDKQPDWLLETSRIYPAFWVKNRDVLTEVMPLLATGVIENEFLKQDLNEPISGEEIVNILPKISQIKKLNQTNWDLESFKNLKTIDFITLSRILIGFNGWQDKAEHFMLESEVKFLLHDSPNYNELKGKDLRALGYLLQSGVFPDFLRVENLKRAVNRAEFIYILKRSWSWTDDLFHQGIFVAKKDNYIEVMEERERRLLYFPEDAYLERKIEEGLFPARKLNLLGGEKISWVENEGKVQLLQVIFPANTDVLDRNSRYNRWTIRLSREDLEKNIRKYYPRIGQLLDLKIIRRGKSGRVAEMQIIGDKSIIGLKGLKIRSVLNLKDTLFYIDREYDADQHLTHFIFTGRGWGHGVGLCQVGAYGMAMAGADYKKILQHYYHNVKIEKIF
ncbi:MAG TPA: SpoIID/LytB domain-containing protein [Candidatus Aminicenantes bacterium]|nr:MAG: hypothetical protein C0168_09090 [Candidatus Aminicenantes bacterium]HEK86352.1 SpoIID/LytB domain-containing protein [Candidatus Aminicenantes bacterium]